MHPRKWNPVYQLILFWLAFIPAAACLFLPLSWLMRIVLFIPLASVPVVVATIIESDGQSPPERRLNSAD